MRSRSVVVLENWVGEASISKLRPTKYDVSYGENKSNPQLSNVHNFKFKILSPAEYAETNTKQTFITFRCITASKVAFVSSFLELKKTKGMDFKDACE